MFDDNKSVDDRLRELHKTRFGHDYEEIFKSIEWTPAYDLICFQDTVNEIKSSAHRAGWELIKKIYGLKLVYMHIYRPLKS